MAARAPPPSTYIGPDKKGLSTDSMEGGGARSTVMLRGTGARLSSLCQMEIIIKKTGVRKVEKGEQEILIITR